MSLRNRLLVAFVALLALSLANVVAARLLSQRHHSALAMLRMATAEKGQVSTSLATSSIAGARCRSVSRSS